MWCICIKQYYLAYIGKNFDESLKHYAEQKTPETKKVYIA